MPDAPLSRNAEVLRCLLEAAPGAGHTKLVKFAYLADLEACRYLGRPISMFRYELAQHGPFDRVFFEANDELQAQGHLTEQRVACGPYEGFQLLPTAKALEYDFSLAEAELLRYVAEAYLGQTARDLCDDVVYQTEPMQRRNEARCSRWTR